MKIFKPDEFILLGFWLEAETREKWTKDRIFSQLDADRLLSVAIANSTNRQDAEFGPAKRAMVCDVIARYEEMCTDAGLTASTVTIRKIKRLRANKGAPDEDELLELVGELKGRLRDEIGEANFFSLTPRETIYYNQPRDGWSEIVGRFQSIGDDVEEASRCMAFSRYAAAVFHSVQVVEFGLIELGTFIGVTDPLSGWTAVSSRLKKIIITDYKSRTDFEKANFVFIEQIQGTVEALKNAWRNKISHAHGKLVVMTTNFSPEVAEEILMATRAFMRRLADGLPVATDGATHA